MERITKSLKIKPAVWKDVKKHCVEKEISISGYIEQLVEKNLKKKE